MQDVIILHVNGERRSVPAPSDVRALLEFMGLRQDRIAVEINRRIIRRADWGDTPLSDGDRVELVQFVGGG